MPAPAVSWVSDTFPTAKSLNLALYTSDGTNDNPTGIAFHAYRPILFESFGTALTITSRTGGSQQSLSSPGPASVATTRSFIYYDTAGYFGQSQDAPAGAGYYQFVPAIFGSNGNGATAVSPSAGQGDQVGQAGGWTIISHFAPVTDTATQVSVSADLLAISGIQNGSTVSTTGVRAANTGTAPTTPFFLDMVKSDLRTWQPAVTLTDSASASASLIVNTVDSSGETPRFYSIWAAASSTVDASAIFNVNGVYQWVAPAGVTSVTASVLGAGGGGGGGNISSGGVEIGAGGGGGGEFAQDTVTVTPGVGYVVNVGAGGSGGAPGVNGNTGANSTFSGDVLSVLAHGGTRGGSASTTASGTGGSGGTGSAAATHFNGGAGASPPAFFFGAINTFGGGGGSSAGGAKAGNDANSSTGARAPAGGGPGGQGGQNGFNVIQSGQDFHNNSIQFTMQFTKPLQQGSALLAFILYQGDNASSDPVVYLTAGEHLTQQVNADLTDLPTSMQFGLYDIYNVLGGETSIHMQGTGHANSSFAIQWYEVSGLGPAPTLDQTGNASAKTNQTNGTYPPPNTTFPVVTASPEFWVAGACGQQLFDFDVNPPGAAQKWIMRPEGGCSSGAVHSRHITGYQVSLTPGAMKFSGTFSDKVSEGWIVAAYIPSADTSGRAPVIGSAGGGGGGLGVSPGGGGFDGAITLTWTGQPGGGYGTPKLPAPYAAWTNSTTIGAVPGVSTVNLNDETGIRDVVNFLSNPPIFRVSSVAAGSLATATNTVINFSGATPTIDNYGGWISNTSTYVIQRDGLYLCHGLVSYAAASAGNRQAAFNITTSGSGQLNSNAGFETDVSGWQPQNGASFIQASLGGAFRGNFYANLVPNGTSSSPQVITIPPVAVSVGTYVTLTAWLKATGGTSEPVTLSLRFLDGGGLPTGGTANTTVTTSTTAWKFGSAGIAVPTSAVTCFGVIFINGTPPVTAFQGIDEAYLSVATTYFGPGYPASSTGNICASKTQIYSLQAGDSIQLMGRHSTGSTLATSTTDASRFFVSWLGQSGLPAGNWTPPDTTFRWQSGTSGDQLPALFQQHLANDLGFLANRPYLLAWQQNSANLNINSNGNGNTFKLLALDTITGMIHGDVGDNYAGWSPIGVFGGYTAQVSGWYLMVGETFMSPPTSLGGYVVAATQTQFTSGGQQPSNNAPQDADYHQQNAATTNASVGGGATTFGMIYLSAGEEVSPGFFVTGWSGTSTTLLGTLNGGNYNSHFEMVWLSELFRCMGGV